VALAHLFVRIGVVVALVRIPDITVRSGILGRPPLGSG